jgi:hypothetical protein
MVVFSTGGTDYHNWGQTYTVAVPMSSFCAMRNGSGVGSWYEAWNIITPYYGGYYHATNSSFTVNYNTLYSSITQNIIPSGATINYIEANYYLNNSETACVSMGWYKKDNSDGSLTPVRGEANVSSGSGIFTETITPTSSAPIMGLLDEHIFEVSVSSGVSWDTKLYYTNINYTL